MAKQNPPKGKQKTKIENPDENQDENPDEDPNEEEEENPEEANNRRINAIVTSRVKREMKGVLAEFAKLSETVTKAMAAKKPESTGDEEEEDEEGKSKTAEVDAKTSRKLTKLERELADERKARQQAEKDRTDEQEKTKRTELRTIFSTALQELGVTDPKLLRAAVNVLEEDGVMIRDEDGKIKYKGADKYGIETNYDPKVGLKSWVAGEGKSFVPAVDAGGSGTGGASNNGGGNGAALTAKDIKKMSPQQIASINLERACTGLPPINQD